MQFQQYTVRTTDSVSAQSISHSPSNTKCHSSFQTVKQNKNLLLVNNNFGCLVLFAQEKSGQVTWFHSTSIFQRLYLYFLHECLAIYFHVILFIERQYSTFHGTSNKEGRL